MLSRVGKVGLGTVSAYDAKTLKEQWSYIDTGINAPPITFAFKGKQYIAVLTGSKQSPNIVPFSPELKNTSTASMLFVCPGRDHRAVRPAGGRR